MEPRCLVCGNPLDPGAPFKKEVRDSEVCSDECYDIYMTNEDTGHIESERCWCEPELEYEDPETGMELKMKYFVLKPKSKFKNDPYAKASRQAMKAYATAIQDENPVLANEIDEWVQNEFLFDDNLNP